MGMGKEEVVGEATIGRSVFKVVKIVSISVLAIIVVAFIACIFVVKANFNIAGYSLHIMNDRTSAILPNGSIYLLKDIERGRTYIENDAITYTNELGEEVPARILNVVESDADTTDDKTAEGDKATSDEDTTTNEVAAPKYNVYTAVGETIIDEVMISGTAEMYIPYVGYAINFIVTPFGLVCCVAIPLFIMLIFEIINLVRLPKSLKEDEETTASLEKRTDVKQFEPKLKPVLDDGIKPDTTEKGKAIVAKDTVSSTISNKSDDKPSELPMESILSAASTNMLEDVGDVVELFGGESEQRPVSYDKPKNIVEPDKDDMQLTREYCLSASSMNIFAKTEAVKAKEDTSVSPSSFTAELFEESPNRFRIDGINVNVEPDDIKLSLEDLRKNTDIAITVTKDYTNITVGVENGQVDFAIFRDEDDNEQKVIIRKKSKQNHIV